MIGKSGERGSGISMLPARHDDYDDYLTPSEFFKLVPDYFLLFESLPNQADSSRFVQPKR